MKLSKKCQACAYMACKEAGAFNYPCNLCKKGKYYKKQEPIKKIDRRLIADVNDKITGADIHAVRGQLSLYVDGFRLLKSKDVRIRVRALQRMQKAESILQLYIKGTSIKEAIRQIGLAQAIHKLR